MTYMHVGLADTLGPCIVQQQMYEGLLIHMCMRGKLVCPDDALLNNSLLTCKWIVYVYLVLESTCRC
jgi:hypothetical protein